MKYYIVQKANYPLMGVPECDYLRWQKTKEYGKDFILITTCKDEKECDRLLKELGRNDK